MNFELIFGVVVVLSIALNIWSNESWYRTCQSINAEWFERMMKLTASVREELDQMQKEIDELEAKLEDSEKLERRIKYLELTSYNEEDDGR